jgi:hypothetical protein
MFDSGIPPGPGLLATLVPLPDSHTKTENTKINTAPIATNVLPPKLLSRSWFAIGFPSFRATVGFFVFGVSDSWVGDR